MFSQPSFLLQCSFFVYQSSDLSQDYNLLKPIEKLFVNIPMKKIRSEKEVNAIEIDSELQTAMENLEMNHSTWR